MKIINKIKKTTSEKRERLIRDTAYKLWEEDGQPGYWSGAKEKHYTLKAIEKLNSPKKLHKYFINSFNATEKQLEKFLAFLKTLAILEILGIVGNISIVIALITFIVTEKQRRNEEIYQAWQVITAAYEQPGSGGRKEALEFLNSEPRRFPLFWLRWNRQNLAGLVAPRAYISEINLQEANLRVANLQQSDLSFANLQEAILFEADLQEANLFEADLRKAILGRANLSQANLLKANLSEANLWKTNLSETHLHGVKLNSANLWEANLSKARLWSANLSNTDLLKANLEGANLKDTNLEGANLKDTNLEGANLEGANLKDTNLEGANLEGANLEGANLKGANLKEANLQEAMLGEVKNLNSKQIKSACFWEKANYKGEWNSENKIMTTIEPDNAKFIEELKKDISSDNEYPINCILWN